MDDDFAAQRLKRDMAELKRLCEEHFEKRREDDEKIKALQDRIKETKGKREASKLIRKEREQEKTERLEKLKKQHQEEEAAKAAKQKARQQEILTAMAGGYDKEAARARRGEKRRLKRRSDVYNKKPLST